MIFDIFSGRRPAVPLAFCQQKSLTKMCRKKIVFLQMVFFTKWLMTKADRSKNTNFLFCEIFIKSKCHSKKFDFIMLFPKVVLISQHSFRNSLRFLCMKWSVELLDMIIWLRLKLWPTLFQCSFHLNYPHEVLRKKTTFCEFTGKLG